MLGSTNAAYDSQRSPVDSDFRPHSLVSAVQVYLVHAVVNNRYEGQRESYHFFGGTH